MKLPIIKFVFDRKKQAGVNKKGGVDIRITHNRVQKFVSTGIRLYPSQWDAEKERVVKGLDAFEYNEILSKMRQRILKAASAMVDEGRFDLNALTASMKADPGGSITFHTYIHRRIIKRQVSDLTKKAYHVFYSRFLAWGGMRLFSDISEKGVRDWDEYLHSFRWTEKDRYGRVVEKKYSQATIGSMHKNLKLFIADAVVDGFVKENPYVAKRIRIDKGETRIDSFLTSDEIASIESSTMPTHSLSEARDLFLMQVYTGLAYIDLMRYDFTKCRNAADYDVFSGYRSKTGVLFTFVLTPKAKDILERYDYLLPKISNQKYNVKLKLVADAAGIDKGISTHDGRRSCGYMLLNAGVPMAVVTRVLGHSSIRQTERAYARLLDDTIRNEIKNHEK